MDKLVSRNIGLTILLVAALVVVILIRTRTPFGSDNASFGTTPGKEITKIELSAKGEQLVLEKKDKKWFVNDRYEARKGGIVFMESILTGLRIKSPVSDEMFTSVITEENIKPVRVRVFENKRIINSFLVYKTTSNQFGNIMMTSERSKSFITYLPGFEGDIGSLFTLNELYWIPYTLFNLLPSEIAAVRYEDVKDTTSSFYISRRGKDLTLSSGGRLLTGWDSVRVHRYISYFTLVPFESWAADLSGGESDSIRRQDPLYRITVTKSDGSASILTLWARRDPLTGETDNNRLWGKTSERDDLFIIRYFDIDPLIKKRAYFFTR